MSTIILVFLGGGLGSVSRYSVAFLINRFLTHHFPFATLLVNLVGCFAMGFLAGVLEGRIHVAHTIRPLLGVGFLGGFTTFSAFSIETMRLLHQKAWASAAINVGSSVVGCLGAVWLGFLLGKMVCPSR